MSADIAESSGRSIDEQNLVRKANRQDLRFAVLGFLVLMLAMATLLALVLDFMIDGVPRIDLDFLTNFPSRRPEQAGILSAWVGTVLVMLTTAALAVPIGIAAGIYLEEYAPKNWITDVIEINVSNLAGVPSIIYGLLALGLFVQTFRLGQTILVAGMTLFSVGTAIQAAYLTRADNTRDRFLVQAPIFGSIAVAASGNPSSDWSTALVFSSITQSIGVIAISIAIPKLLELRALRRHSSADRSSIQ